MPLEIEDADRLKQPQRAERVGIGGIFRRLETHLHMALRREIVDLVGLNLLNDADQVGRIGQVAVMHEEADIGLVRVLVEMIDAVRIDERGTALDAVDDIALVEQEFGEKRPILAGDAGDERDFGF